MKHEATFWVFILFCLSFLIWWKQKESVLGAFMGVWMPFLGFGSAYMVPMAIVIEADVEQPHFVAAIMTGVLGIVFYSFARPTRITNGVTATLLLVTVLNLINGWVEL